MSRSEPLPRRAFLRGVGAALALPWLEAMTPRVWGAARVPQRLLFLYVPNGKHMVDWTPSQPGARFPLPWILEPLEKHKRNVLVLSGLTLDGARSHGDGPGDHARSLASFLTTAHPRKTGGIRLGPSVDQVAASKLGRATRFPSLELGCERSRQAGTCDSGYSCAYSSNLSWKSATTPMGKEINPRLVFERLFGDRLSPQERKKRNRWRKSVLDLVAEDAERLRGKLGRSDRGKLDEYLSGVRELEKRIAKADTGDAKRLDVPEPPGGIPKHPRDRIRIMSDLITLAFRADLTRVATLLVANAGNNRTYRFLGVRRGHHSLSHHGGDEQKQAQLRKINRFHVEQLAYLLDQLSAAPAGEGTLLDHTTVVYGSGISDGNRHNHEELPILVCGRGGGTLEPGRHLRFPRETPLANLYLSLLHKNGVRAARFGDSTGALPGLG